jgi:hypothetical protein
MGENLPNLHIKVLEKKNLFYKKCTSIHQPIIKGKTKNITLSDLRYSDLQVQEGQNKNNL